MINLEAAYNSLSFGNISFGITNELSNRNIETNVFPIGGNVDISAFDKASENYKQYLQNGVNNAIKKYKKNIPYLKIWHIAQSWHKISEPSYLLTFHELDQLSDIEVNILNSYSKIFVTSTFSKQVFEDYGVKTPVIYVPMGFDSVHYSRLNKPRPLGDNIIIHGIFGKVEKRKRTQQTIRAWIKKYGGNHNHRLHLHINNPFYKPEEMNGIFNQIFEGQRPPFNVTIFGFQPTNTLMNECYNAIDIVIDMSGGESIGLGPLTSIAIGKHGIINNNSGMKDWAKLVDCVKIQPKGKEPAEDGKFFGGNGSPFNFGNIYTYDDDEFIAGLEEVVKKFEQNPVNESGFKLQEEYSYKKGVDIILKEMNI